MRVLTAHDALAPRHFRCRFSTVTKKWALELLLASVDITPACGHIPSYPEDRLPSRPWHVLRRANANSFDGSAPHVIARAAKQSTTPSNGDCFVAGHLAMTWTRSSKRLCDCPAPPAIWLRCAHLSLGLHVEASHFESFRRPPEQVTSELPACRRSEPAGNLPLWPVPSQPGLAAKPS